MVIQDDGCYAFVQLASFRGIRCMSDLVMIPTIMSFYDQLKVSPFRLDKKVENMFTELHICPIIGDHFGYQIQNRNRNAERSVAWSSGFACCSLFLASAIV